jgi:XTP/dITP diphosphohydrolase
MIEVVIGTSNPGKVRVVTEHFADLPIAWQPRSESELGLDIAEDGATFEANAELKARAFAAATNQAVLASDGGLEILALNNWPGLKSRRLDADRYHTDEELIEIMQEKITNLPAEQRQFRFVTAWSFAVPGGAVAEWAFEPESRLSSSENVRRRQGLSGLISREDAGRLQPKEAVSGQNAIRRQPPVGAITTTRGELLGTLTEKLHPQPVPGFPYRRFWWIPKFHKYFLDLAPDEYNEVHHNRIAFEALRPTIETYLRTFALFP